MDEHALLQRLAESPADADAIRRLEALYRAEQRWTDLAAHMLDRLEHTEDVEGRRALYEKAARLFEERLDDPEKAFIVLLEGFREGPDDGRFARHLARYAEKARQWDALCEAYEEARAGRADALPFHRRLAEWYVHLDREADALPHWRAILETRPEDEPARAALEAHLETHADWHGLVESLNTRLGQTRSRTDRARLQERIGRIIEEKMGAPEEALRWLGQVYVQAPDDALAMRLRRLAEETGAWHELAAIYDAAIRPDDPVESVTEQRVVLADLYRDKLGDPERAAEEYERVVALDPESLRAVRALRELLEQTDRVEKLASVLAHEAELTPERYDRFLRYLALGDLLNERLDAPKEAVDAWFKALEARPDDKQVLVRLLAVYGKLRLWEASIKVVKKLVKLEDDPAKKAQFIYAMGVIQRDELDDHYVAVRTLDKALEHDPTMVKAFQAIDEILTDDQDFARQDRYYRKMLVRAKEHRLDDALVVKLARNLGEINRSRLGNHEAALKAYDIVLKRCPDDAETLAVVAELRTVLGQHTEAAQVLDRLLDLEPMRASTYHQLYRLYLDAGQLDAAWCLAQALAVLGQADADQQRLYEQGRDRQGGQPRRRIEGDDWKLLTAPGKGEAIDAVLLRVFPTLGPAMALRPKDLGLNKKKDRVDVAAAGTFGNVLSYVGDATSIAVPEVWFGRNQHGIRTALLSPPALMVGADMSQRGVAELAFSCARTLFFTAQQHFLASVDDDPAVRRARLLQILTAAIKTANPATPLQADPGLLKTLAGTLSPPDAAAIGQLGPRLAAAGPGFGLDAWLAAVDASADRLGLLLCGDLATAVELVRAEPRPLDGADAGTRVLRLVRFAVSPAYFELRRRLGLAVRT